MRLFWNLFFNLVFSEDFLRISKKKVAGQNVTGEIARGEKFHWCMHELCKLDKRFRGTL